MQLTYIILALHPFLNWIFAVTAVHWITNLRLSVHTQDISHLVDICRQTIIFDDLSSLAECMRIISGDTEARVVRIKNRLDPAFNTARSAGYRDLALNLKVANEETLGMGLEEHVCEVQLILLPMYQLKVRCPAWRALCALFSGRDRI